MCEAVPIVLAEIYLRPVGMARSRAYDVIGLFSLSQLEALESDWIQHAGQRLPA